ncbi:MAG: autotransporter domain-containing protein [Akkermansia sp.]|nr:autotransporter domain-containing protein [Akkermansia sp.]
MTLSGAKTYTGMTTVNSGTLTLGGGLKSDVTINGGTLNTGSGLALSNGQDILLKSGSISGNLTTSAGSSLTISPSSASVNGALTLGGGTLNLDDNILNVSGALTLNSRTTLTVSGSYGYGDHTLITAGSINGSTDYLSVSGIAGGCEIKRQGNSLILSITRAPRDIDFPAGGTWANNGEPFVNGDRVTFTDCGTVTVVGTVKPGAMTVTGEGDTTWGGSGSVAGNSALIKDGSGTLTINTSNSFSDGTEIRQGTVSAGADNALGTGAVTMQEGTTLKLNGRNLGQNDVTVAGNATLAAGSGGQVKSLTVSTKGGAQGQQGELLFAEKLALSGTLKTGTLTLEKGNIEGGSITVTGAATVEQGFIGSNISGNTLEKTGDKRVELKGDNGFSGGVTVSGGQLALLEGGSFAGNVSVKTGAAILAGVTVNGDITLASGADMHLRPDTTYKLQHKLTSSGGTLHGNFTTASGAAITLNTSSTSTAGLTVSGTLTLTSSLTQGSLSAGGSWSTGSTYTLIQADHLNDQSGKSPYTLFNLSESGYTITNTGSAVTLKKKAVSAALQRMAATTAPAMAADDGGGIIITGAPEPLLTETAVDGVADAMVQADWGVVDAGRAFGNALRGTHGNLRALGNGNSAVWVNAFGNMSRQSTVHGHAGADRDLTGAALGFETMAGEHGVAGIGIGHSWSRVNTFGMSRLKQDAQHTGVYGRARVHATDKNSLWIEGSAAYGKTESRGQLGYSRERWSQNSGSLAMRVNDVLQLDGGTSLNFFGGMEYLATDNGNIEDVKTGSVQNMRGEIGAGIMHTVGNGVVFAEAALQGDMVRHNPQADVGIRRHGANPGRIGGSISVGGAYSLGEHWSVNAAYTFGGVKHSNSHSANVGATFRF